MQLLKRGYKVRALIRGEPAPEEKFEQVEYVKGSVTDQKSLIEASKGCEGIFHLAGIVIHSRYFPKEVYETNLDGTMNVMEAAKISK